MRWTASGALLQISAAISSHLLISLIGRRLFHAPVSDFHCGMRGLSQEALRKLELRTGGMEIATEMVVKAAARKLRIVEVPITLHLDGRGRPPHLRTWRDGWRHLRFMVVLSPRFVLLLPGLALMLIGAVALASLAGGEREWLGVAFGVHTMANGAGRASRRARFGP